MDILISGLGIAGPTLAYWLGRAGHRPVIVEQAPSPRTGGYIIDFWGTGYDVAERMDLIPKIEALDYKVREVRFVGGNGHKTGGFSADVFRRVTSDRYASLRRSDLAGILYREVQDSVDVMWKDSVAALRQGDQSVTVWFTRSPPREFDLVIGADGLHSVVRQLVFGDQTRFESYLGYKVAAFDAAGYRPQDERVYVSYAAPGVHVARFSMRDDRTMFLIVFRDAPSATLRADGRVQVRDRLQGLGWECPAILRAMDEARDIYFDRVSQIRMPSWSAGRVALVGDAAACPSLLAGEGAALAMTAAYVLAGELATTSNPDTAFARYADRLRPLFARKQHAAKGFGWFFVPRTRFAIAARNLMTRLFAIPAIADMVLGNTVRDDFALPEYRWDHPTPIRASPGSQWSARHLPFG